MGVAAGVDCSSKRRRDREGGGEEGGNFTQHIKGIEQEREGKGRAEYGNIALGGREERKERYRPRGWGCTEAREGEVQEGRQAGAAQREKETARVGRT